MPTSMWRMNGICRKMAGLVVLCTLMFSSVVICQDTANSPNASLTAEVTPVTSTAAPQDASDTPGVNSFVATTANNSTARSAVSTAPVDVDADADADADVNADADADVNAKNVAAATTKSTQTTSSSDSSVFAGLLVSGLLAAIGITIGYFYCQRRPDTKGTKLTDEAYPADQENQGSTLASVAPLNPPPETQEKPSVNGESPEAAKTQPPPPNNGHSTTKTADTEL